MKLNPFERIDDLLTDGLKIIQNKKEFCFSLDAVLLAHFVHVRRNDSGLDLGTGTGVIPLLLAKHVREMHAIEINAVTADLARRNAEMNGLAKKIVVRQADYRHLHEFYPAQSADFVVANPPYRPIAHGDVNKIDGVAMARHEITASLEDVVMAARYALKFHGRFAMVHLPERLAEIMVEMDKNSIIPKKLRFVQPKREKKPNMVLIEGIAGGAKGGLKVDTPLVVHNDDGSYKDELLRYYYPDAAGGTHWQKSDNASN
ncbi:tRNA1(Val) (adenine(37)-N6)-methyltransferase [Pectinatus haikarae]|uniref:tRNA1(Val) (adenine(37)-N6)-methyltransferase n=1 Tax=Pectinatus haikarae TaxID=349096 RepID=UPI0018C78EAF|nr:methyltransferase [Pectinatus haikarae]